MEPGTLIATRGSGTRLVELRYETTIDGVDYGIVVGPTGATGTPTPIVAALAKGYWESPDTVVKHGSHDQSSHGRRFASSVDPAVAAKAIRLVGENGGLSIKMTDGAEPTAGFMVARDSKKFGTAVTADEFYGPEGGKILGEFVVRNRANLASGKAYLGVWHQKTKIVDGVEIDLDRKDQIVHLDVTDNVPSRERAIRLGRRRDQISIWDVANFEEIQTGGSGAEVNKRDPLGRDPEGTGRHERRRDHGMGGDSPRGVSGSGQVRAVVVRFEPGLVPVLKHADHDQSTHGRGGRIGVHTGQRLPRTEDNPKGLVDAEGANAKLIKDATTMENLPVAIQAKVREGVQILGLDDEQIDANVTRVLDEAEARARREGKDKADGEEWYEEANGAAVSISRDTGLSEDQASGMLAASSVSHDWPSNQAAAEYAARAISQKHAVQVDDLLTRTRMKEGVEMSYYDIARAELGGDGGRMMDGKRRRMPSADELRGKTVDDLDPYVAAAIIKAQSQIGYRTQGIGGVDDNGQPFNRDGQSLIAKSDTSSGYGGVTYACGVQHLGRAVAIAQGADPDNVLNGHKVRSFYNNIRDPRNPANDVTVDSHAFSISLGRRVSNSSPEYKFFSGSGVDAERSWTGSAISPKGNSNTYGTSGLYAAFADAYRRVGASRTPPLTARQVQAITWVEWRRQRAEAGLPVDDVYEEE